MTSTEGVRGDGDTTLPEAIAAYHGLLSDEVGAESAGQLAEQLRRRDLYFGERPLCTVLRPRFMTPRRYRFLRNRVEVLLGAFDRAYRRALTDPEFRRGFGLTDWEEALIRRDSGLQQGSPVSRLDAFFGPGDSGLKFTEYNAETPAGASYGDLLASVFLGLPVMRAFLRDWEIRPLPARHRVMGALLDAYREWGGSGEAPRVGILDWRDVPTFSEFRITAQYLASQGIDSVICDPREVEYRDGELRAGDFHITLVYKRVLIRELVERGGLDHPVVRAVQDGAVCMVNPFRCKILHKKASLAVVGDERNSDMFSGPERDAIRRHVPWTRVLEERRTRWRGREVDLLPFVADHRERLVLKPNDDYGGAGIVLGWEVTDEQWAGALKGALEHPPYIVQERVALPTEPYPNLDGGRVRIVERMIDTAPFCFYGDQVDGCLTRLSSAALLNVTAGEASTVPTFLVERR